MTLVEFLHPLRGSKQRDLVLAAMYYLRRYEGAEAVTVDQVRAALVRARIAAVRKMNVAAVLANSGHFVDSPGTDGARRLWTLTDSGSAHVRNLLGLPEAEPEVEHDVAKLTTLAGKVADPDVREYLEEAIVCLSVGALRAAIVFVWTAAIRGLHEKALAQGAVAVTAAVQKHDPKARDIRTLDDFAYVKDRTFLHAVRDLGILDKGEKDTLVEALNLRNRCGHPTKYRPGEARAKAFIEDVIGVVF